MLQKRIPLDPLARELIEKRRIGSFRLQSVAAAIQNLLLALHGLGLGACWMTCPLLIKKEIEELIEVPPGMDFLALIPVGYPAETPKAGYRKPLSEVVRFID